VAPRVRIPVARACIRLIVLGYVAGVATGVVAFTMWSQIIDLIKGGATLTSIDFTTQAHALRFTLMWPVIQFSALTGAELDWVFSWVVAAVVLLTAHLVDRTRGLVVDEVWRWHAGRAVSFGVFVGLSLFMNGRLSFAFLGMALLLYVLMRRGLGRASNLRTVVWFPLVLWLTSVSSGTFTVALGTMMVWAVTLLFTRYPSVRLRDAVLLAPLAAGALALSPVMLLYIRKNVDYYGGGIEGFFNMLNHGPGMVIATVGPEIVTPLAIIGLLLGGFLVAVVLTRNRAIAPPTVAVVVSMAVGVFGFSTLLMGLPGLVVLAGAWLTPAQYRRVPESA